MRYGFTPPSDFAASPNCPKSKARAPGASLCNNDCKLCTTQHKWNKCHMYGLGIYFADQASKSDLYVHDSGNFQAPPQVQFKDPKSRKMLLCAVNTGRSSLVKEELQKPDELHDKILPPKGYDSLTILGNPNAKKGQGVLNNECMYTSLHLFIYFNLTL